MFENVNHPIKDGIIADNSTLSSRKIKELVESATELPTPAAGDNGKVLTVNSDLKYDLEAVPDELPAVTSSDNTKILTVSGGKWAKGSKIPVPTAAGKLLQSKANGDFELIDNAMSAVWEKLTYSSFQTTTGIIQTTAAQRSKIITELTYGQRVKIYSEINNRYVMWDVVDFDNTSFTVRRIYMNANAMMCEIGTVSSNQSSTTIAAIN